MASQPDLSAAKASEPRRKLGSLRMIWIFMALHSLMLVWTAFSLGGRLPSSRMLTQMMVIATIFFSLLVGVLALYRP